MTVHPLEGVRPGAGESTFRRRLPRPSGLLGACLTAAPRPVEEPLTSVGSFGSRGGRGFGPQEHQPDGDCAAVLAMMPPRCAGLRKAGGSESLLTHAMDLARRGDCRGLGASAQESLHRGVAGGGEGSKSHTDGIACRARLSDR